MGTLTKKDKNRLTKRETEIAWLVVEGFTNKEIAVELNLSTHTVKNHLVRTYVKLKVDNRVKLMNKMLGK